MYYIYIYIIHIIFICTVSLNIKCTQSFQLCGDRGTPPISQRMTKFPDDRMTKSLNFLFSWTFFHLFSIPELSKTCGYLENVSSLL